MKYTLSLIAVIVCIESVLAQRQLVGQLVDARSKEPLPFVNILVKGESRGTTSDLDGRFNINVSNKDTLVFSYVGYERLQKSANEFGKSLTIIQLVEKSIQLNELVIRPENNPAWKIIEKAIEHKPLNDPENLLSFTYQSYNRLYATAGEPDTSIHKNEKIKDSVKIREFFEKNHLFLMESTTKRIYRKPHFNKEIVTGNRMTGVKDPFFSFMATDFQPFSFYKDFITLFGKTYLSPLSNGFENRYDFTLQDTIYHQTDSIFVISFEPMPGKKFESMTGQLYISSDGYAVEHIIAQPADETLLIVPIIQQAYRKVNGHWFPSQLHSELRFKELSIMQRKLKYVSRSFISNVIINEPADTKTFNLVTVEFDKHANHQPESFWAANRLDSLGRKEINTIRYYDSLAPKLTSLNNMMKISEAFIVGKFKAGKFYIPISNILRFNQYEGTRLGFGLQTSEELSKVFSLHAYSAYGFKDRSLKYGSSLSINMHDRKQTSIAVSFHQDVTEPGSSSLLKNPIRATDNVRNWFTSRMDSVQEWKLSFISHPIAFSTMEISTSKEWRNPTYAYQYTSPEITSNNELSFTKVALNFRYAYKENYTRIRNTNVVTNIAHPQVNISLVKSASGLIKGAYNFTRAEIQLDEQIQLRGLGKTSIQLGGGMVRGKTPYAYLFNGKGSNGYNSTSQSILLNNYFQTMGLYEFVSDTYANLFITQSIGRITNAPSKYFRPELALVHSMGYGKLNHPEYHQGITFKTMEKGFLESGAIVTNLLKINYFNMLYYGLGGGFFYRYGPYVLPTRSENFAFKFILTVSF